MRHETAAVLAIVAIVVTTFVVIGGQGVSGPVTGFVVADGTPSPVAVERGELVLLSGFIEPETTITLRDGALVFAGGSVESMTADLVRSDASSASFTLAKDSFSLTVQGVPGPSGGLYAPFSYDVLADARREAGPGRYTVTASTTAGSVSTAFVLE